MHAVLVLFRPLPNVGIQNFSMWGMYNLAKAYRNINKSRFGRCSTPWPSVQERHWMPFCESKWPNDLEGQGQWPPFSIPADNIPECMFGANFVVVAQIYDELSHGQAEFPSILSQNGQNDLEGQGPWPPFSIPAESIPGCMFGSNLKSLAQIYDELSCGEAEILSHNGQSDLEGHGQWPLFSIPTESIPWCMFGANLVIPAQICDELSCGQSQVYGRTDGHLWRIWSQLPWRKDAGNNNTPSAWNAKG